MAHLLLAAVAVLILVRVVQVVLAAVVVDFIPRSAINPAVREQVDKVIPVVLDIEMIQRLIPMVEVEVVKALLAAVLVTAIAGPVVVGLPMG
jgi:hypothetical protein